MNPKQAPVFLVRPTEIGAKILEIAERERALEPDMYIDRNLDYGDTEFRAQHGITGSRIREFFVQGVQGSWVTGWDQRPKTEKPPWCAAFASYCYRKAYEELGIPLPVAPKANVSGMCAVMQRIDRLLPGADVFDSDRQLLKGRQSTPGPGDFVLFNNHVALLRGIDTEGRIHTIEGNTYAFTDTRRPQRKVWGIFCKSYSAEKNPERWTDLKFGLSASR